MTGVQREAGMKDPLVREGDNLFGFLKLFCMEVLNCISELYIRVDIFTGISEAS